MNDIPTTEKPAPKPNFFKSMLIALVILVILLPMILGFDASPMPVWPFIFFLFYFTTFAGMARDKLLTSAVGGLIGILASFTPPILYHFFGVPADIGMLLLLVPVLLILTAVVDRRFKYVDPLCLLMLTVLTNIAGATYLGVVYTPLAEFLLILASYAIGVALFFVVTTIMAGRAKKKAASQ